MKNRENRAAYNKVYYAENREEIAAKAKIYRAENREELAAKAKIYRAENREEIAAKAKIYKAENREELAAYKKFYDAENREELAAQRKVYNAENRGKLAERHRFNMYGVTPDDFKRTLVEQGGVCAICGGLGGKTGLCVDHDHETNKVRGLLCSMCNTGIGFFKDSSDSARRAAGYLKRWENKEYVQNMKITRYQIATEEMMENSQWRWTALLWLNTGAIADLALKSLIHYPTEAICIDEAKKLLTELGIEVDFKPMNKNTRRKKAENPGAHEPRKTKKPKVAASAAEITRRISKERGS